MRIKRCTRKNYTYYMYLFVKNAYFCKEELEIIRRKIEGIIDIHTHILPGIDDGSRNMEETLRMLQTAYAEGITRMIATPHYKSGRHNASPEKIHSLIKKVQLQAEIQGIPVQIYPGNELLFFDGMEDALEEKRICTMNETEYILVEFMPQERYVYIRNALDSVFGMGYQPIMAHVERVECMVKTPAYVAELCSMGVGIQINASSITGEAGFAVKRFTHKLLKAGLADYVGTDAHSCKGRTPTVRKCSELLYKKYDSRYVDAILYGNAARNLLCQKEEF